MPSHTPETTPPKKTVTPAVPQDSQELIRLRAYQLYEDRGREDGHADEDWLRAETEILSTGKENAAAA